MLFCRVLDHVDRAARLCRVLAFAVGGGCSVYDHSLSTTVPDDEGRDAEVSDAMIASDASDNADAENADDMAPTDDERVDDDVADAQGSQDADAAPEDTGTRLDAADAIAENSDAPEMRPTGVTLVGVVSPSAQQAPTASGSPFSQTCMPNEVVLGYTGTIDAPDATLAVLRTFQAVCGSLSVTGGATFGVITTTRETLPVVGTKAGPVSQVQLCPANEVVVGFGGRSGSDIDQIAILCAPLTISGASPDFVLSVGNADMRPGLGGQGGGPFAAVNCPVGMVAVGNEGRAAFTINAFGLLCRKAALVVQ